MKSELIPLQKLLERLNTHTDMYTVLSDFFAISAYNISIAVDKLTASERQKMLTDIAKKYTQTEIEIMGRAFVELITLFEDHGLNDWLGELYMYSNTSSSKAGQFFTPYDVSQMCADVSAQDVIDRLRSGEDVITVSEPACGSGGMILAFADAVQKAGVNYCEHVLADCADLDLRCVHMAYVQLSLAGIPAVIRNQNTLTLEQYGSEWHTPALVFNWLKYHRYVWEVSRNGKL